MSAYQILTGGGVADPDTPAKLTAIKAELKQPNQKLLLHLHGGLVNVASGRAIATALSGADDQSWKLGGDWTQVYVIWRTGLVETVKENWTDLARDDRLYQVILRKLIGFVAKKLGVPNAEDILDGSRSVADAFSLDDNEIQRRITGKINPQAPFADVDIHLGPGAPDNARAAFAPQQSNAELSLEFQEVLRKDMDFNAAVADVDGIVNQGAAGRGPLPPKQTKRGTKSFNNFDDSIQAELTPPPAPPGQRSVISVGAFILQHAGNIALRCFKRFRARRDHGLHATIVEELCRELYGDLVGAKIWGMMVQDAADHFEPPGFGTAFLQLLRSTPPSHFVVTAHSAGSIWASRMLLAMQAAGMTLPVNLFLMAPAVRSDLFAQMLASSSAHVARCRMYAMSDVLEAADGVLGHDKGWVYPSSLLYLVSGLFEEKGIKAYPDAPLLGMERFAGASFLDAAESADAHAIAAFFNQPDKGIVYATDVGICEADSHGGFDNEPKTLASLAALF